jgi:hypothetical protein
MQEKVCAACLAPSLLARILFRIFDALCCGVSDVLRPRL